MALFATVMLVPLQPTTCGLDAGKSAWLPGCAPGPSGKSLAPLSPAAQYTVTPMAAAAWKAWSIAMTDAWVHTTSGEPQLIEITDGRLVVSCTAVVIASMN